VNLGVGGRTESGLAVSRLGFGTAGLGRSLSRGERLRLLETAFDSGITYFDTAPLYGAGAAEEALGAFLRGTPDGVTVATKAGILPAPVAALVLSRLVGRTAVARGGRFTPGALRASLESSLRRLRVARVDLLLLHEVTAADVDESVLAELDAAVRRGDVAHVGIATNASEAAAILAGAGTFPEVVQVPADPAPPDVGARRLVVHSALVGRAGAPGELLRKAAVRYPSARLLFGSRQPAHVRETVQSFLEDRTG
jgi:aryl-alcohol dehydrogenase-like predicted oxidoreductase